MKDEELIQKVEGLRNVMVSVATGGARINEVNESYQREYRRVDRELRRRNIENPIKYADLWEWYGRWSSGDLPSYASRRSFLAELFNPLLERLRDVAAGRVGEAVEPTGWPRVDRNVDELRRRLAEATTEEQYQAVGLLCREALISLGQAVYDPDDHESPDGVEPSDTDARRMLEAYIAAELGGRQNQETRRLAQAALRLALALQHHRTAGFRQAAMCVEATTTMVNLIAIASGRRDP